MGNVGSRLDDSGDLFFKDQTRFTIASVTISNSRGQVLLHLTPNSFPATRYTAKREIGDDSPIEYIQDPDLTTSASAPTFLLRLTNEDDLNFNFTFILRQTQTGNTANSVVNGVATSLPEVADTVLTGLTFAHATNAKELDNLITREFHANPNLQNNSNVQFVGDYTTGGSPSVQFNWSWKWKPPKHTEDRGNGWRNSCSFLDYDQRANRLNTLAHFSFWVHNCPRSLPSPQILSPNLEIPHPVRNRMPSSQSVLSHFSDADAISNILPPPGTPPEAADSAPLPPPPPPPQVPPPPPPVRVDLSHSRPGEDMSVVEDGPLFRATMKALEQKTGNMRSKIKKVLKKAEAAQQARNSCNEAAEAFLSALSEAATSNSNAIQPALDHYFEKIARQILNYERLNTIQLQKLVIEPLIKLYNNDIKQAEAKKKEFEEESRDYYAYVSRYLGQRQDSLKEKKRAESDSKYQAKRRNFELKRFDYSSFMQDLHGGRKEQEVLSHLTRYADEQAKSFLAAAKKVDDLLPQLDALIHEVHQVDKEFQFQRTEREEKRRALEKSSNVYMEPDSLANPGVSSTFVGNGIGTHKPEPELGRADSTGSQLRSVISNSSSLSPPANANMNNTASGVPLVLPTDNSSGQQRKEGLLWALSRPGSHIDPKGINKQAWHKFWIVLDQGKLSEYSNWKQKLDLHMEPIDLRMASVREARNAERRFCFEVITPQFKRIYQATSEDDMGNWIRAINNALQSAVEGRGMSPPPAASKSNGSSLGRDIGSVLTGKSSSYSGQHSYSTSSTSSVSRRTTVGARPSYVRTDSTGYEENPAKLLQTVRDADQGNNWCADCGSTSKVEWVSINLGIVLCIECSGIHRSLGTHISKIRSLTLDVNSFSNDIVEILLQVGNRVSNMVWEATLDQTQKPIATSTREQRLKFITAKYSERAYVQSLPSPLSRFSTPDETLLAAIKKNDIQGVLYGIALRANVNITDRSRNTHAVFLALAAADPASPGSTASNLPPRPSTANAIKVVPFPIAELLVQNGAEIPLQPPPIPLTPAAQLYLSQRTSRLVAPIIGKSAGDTVGSLPSIRGTSNDHAVPSSSLDSKERDKLQKRGSAGARFAGKVASLGIER
ncbi:putative ARF GTPase activator (Csx2) [Aspergillus clavatus NRRL 1]|uniref:ADP-ribosylation factor GTPase-activating protein n=1 Tax=Aspergillus clavatus (strain ATCC 1007 / CBS 513.65 / DSM 816 / NCTC 3887 / NRRL 1 / QM 1276 / 107) TaxID=344612 RepID=A1CD67_ASPCL|nr:ARF GTPase activator (Csx2), putative [Aspergillus clavatus NRRL 1]EAW11794.1 ARF GTPase activator (Csx2), putative [Aspergillus clavatus NRRL 1]